MEAAFSAADPAPMSPDLGFSALGSPNSGLEPVHMEESYVDALVSASLRMVRKRLPVEVQCHGVRMLQHLVYFRKKELRSTQFADLRKVLVGSLDDLVLKDATAVSDDPVSSTPNPKENNKHRRCLLAVLSVNTNLRALAATETNAVIGKVTAGGEGNLNLLNSNSKSGWTSDRSGGIWNQTSCSSASEDYNYVPFMNYPDIIGDINNIVNACKEFADVVEPAMLVNVEMMLSHRGKESLLLMEHIVISQAFLTLKSYSGMHQFVELIPCLLGLLNKIWTLPEWRSKYLSHGSGLSCLFSDGPFLKMVHYMVRFCEVELRRACTQVFNASKSCEPYIVTYVGWILPLILELLQCIHGLWYPPIACSLSEVVERAKYPRPCFPCKHAHKLFLIKGTEGSQEQETRELIEGIRESGYSVIGLCASIEGAFSWLLTPSVSSALSKYLASLEFRHLGKLIKLTVVPLVKNCPSKFWKEWVDNFLRQLLRHCESILERAWSKFLFHGRAGAPYYFGKLSGSEWRVKASEWYILCDFTREVSSLLEVVALTEQNRALPLEDVTQDKKGVENNDFVPSTSLLRYLVSSDCFGMLRMGLFGYFVDDTSTSKAIPFCRALVCLAVDSKDARLRIFILDNLLPCLIQRLDNKLTCAIQSLRCEMSLSESDSASKGLAVLCQELYGYILKCGYVQTQALIEGDRNNDDCENSFEVWLRRQKEDFRAKACSAAARKLSFGCLWRWEFEDECRRYFSAYIDMLLMVDATSEFVKDIYVDKARLFQKLSPEFKAKYTINSWTHPYIRTISSIQHRKFYSMANVDHNRKICDLVHQLINLKPYIKGSDRPFDVFYRVTRTSEIPAEFSKYVVPSAELLLRSVLFFWEARFHPMIREAQMNKLSAIIDVLTTTECVEPLEPFVRDFPVHLQPYAWDFIDTRLKESKYYIAKQQTSLHEEFDEYLASGELDDDLVWFMFSKDDFVEFAVSNVVPSQFAELERSLINLSFERRAEIVTMQSDIFTYAECLRGLLASEPLKVQAQCLISELEAESFFDVDSSWVNWGKAAFSELVDTFNSKLLSRDTLPRHYAIRGLIDCRTILLQKDISLDQAFEKVVVDVCNSFTGYLPKFWKDTRYYRHQYYDIIRDPLRQVNWCLGLEPF